LKTQLLLGIDGGGTKCRARLCAASGAILGEGLAGPANIRFGLDTSIAAVLDATGLALQQAGLTSEDLPCISACLALAGASEPASLMAAQAKPYPFSRTVIVSDAQAACVGAHRGKDGGILVVGTGSIGWAEVGGRHYRVGGWGLPVSDEGSGAWLGCEALRRALWAHDQRIAWTGLLKAVFARFDNDAHAIVRWALHAPPRDFASLAPLVTGYAERQDAAAVELMRLGGAHLDALAARLFALGAERLSLFGGLAPHMTPWLAGATRMHLVPPAGDALDGALQLARAAAESAAAERKTAG
jgi:glucosamine kinase